MCYFSTSKFEAEVAELTKKARFGYSKCREDIANILDKPFESLIQLDERIILDGKILLRKIRVPNKEKKEGKSGGYRILVIFDIEKKTITLGSVYPKHGHFGKAEEPGGAEYQRVLQVYLENLVGNSMNKLDIKKNLSIEPKIAPDVLAENTKICTVCSGNGVVQKGTEKIECIECHGKGVIEIQK